MMTQDGGASPVAVTARRCAPWSTVGRDWDELAERWGGSYRGARGHERVWTLKRFPRARLRLFDIHGGPRRDKIGQCAVALHRGGGRFLDRLLVESDESGVWEAAMQAVLERLPPGCYSYGWELNLEPPREYSLARLPGVVVEDVRPLTVHAVDFAGWASWEDYHKAISTNVKRNVKKAVAEHPDIVVERRAGAPAIWHVRRLVRLRSQTFARKGLPFRPLPAALSTVTNLLLTGRHTFTALAITGEGSLAAFSGIRFGSRTYYADGGSAPENQGAAWFLLTEQIRAAYDHDPTGWFVMGYLDQALHEEVVGGGLLRSRRSCRVSELPTSVVSFTWSGPRGSR